MVERRVTSRSLVALAVGVLLAGCAAKPPVAWRIEGNTRIAHGSVDSAAAGYLALARRYEGEHREALAADAYRKAVRESPSSVDVLQASGLGLAGLGDLAGAIAWLQRAAELRPDQAAIANNLGYALMLAGRDTEAAAALQRALAVAPAYRAAQINLEHLEQRQLARRASPPALPPAVPTPGAVAVVAAAPSAPTPASTARVDVVNGNGVSGLAARWRVWLRTQGVATGRLANLLPYDTATTVVQYRPGFQSDARELAARLRPEVPAVETPGLPLSGPLRIVIGHDSPGADPG